MPRSQVLKSLGVGTERELAFLEVVDAANPANDIVNRKVGLYYVHQLTRRLDGGR